jgi:hypothetical protein
MQFKHPEILYALLLLIIPIIVHLFQLQRFSKTLFTNVKILKRIEQNTRKSARLKKWLILSCRLLTFACLILAFSQPYFSKISKQQDFHTSLYLDNSLSMQSKGENGELLQSSAQEIIKNNHLETNKISLLTNDGLHAKLDPHKLKNELINTSFSPFHLDITTALLKLSDKKEIESNTLSNTLLISDFQYSTEISKVDFTNVNSQVWLVKSTPTDGNNIFIDSLHIENSTSTEIALNVLIRSTKNSSENVPVSLYNKEELFGKSSAQFNNSKEAMVKFTIPNHMEFDGLISVSDDNLEFDDDFYFTIASPEKINVLSIGNSSNYLNKIFTDDEFNYNSFRIAQLNYNTIQNQHLIILNEIDEFPAELVNNLSYYSKNQGNLLIIPSDNSDLRSYNSLLVALNMGAITEKLEQSHKITSINYDHPIANDIFEKRITNFSYPIIDSYYKTKFITSATLVGK